MVKISKKQLIEQMLFLQLWALHSMNKMGVNEQNDPP
jgi:hypothetical protein